MHPYGVMPMGFSNKGADLTRHQGLGDLAPLQDEVIINVLHCLNAADLCRLSTVSRALYCFCNHEDIWKALVLQELAQSNWVFQETWQETYLCDAIEGYAPGSKQPRAQFKAPAITSDVLYQPFLYASISIDPAWLSTNSIDRRSNLSYDEFIEKYEKPNIPVILTDVVRKWPAMEKWKHREYLAEAFQGLHVIVGDAPMRFDSFLKYCDTNNDELPLYLFDKTFATKAPRLGDDYSVPDYFAEDLFCVLEDKRPDYKWLIMGAIKSGSSFHKDPNATSAWNAVITGSKKWLMYPPHITPPGVQPHGVDVASPLSLMEWFVNFYDHKVVQGVSPLECTVHAGDLLFVPSGWWHIAMNLEETIAITQNFCSQANLYKVLRFLSTKDPLMISGIPSDKDRVGLYDLFLQKLREKRPAAVAKVLHLLESDQRQREVCQWSIFLIYSENSMKHILEMKKRQSKSNWLLRVHPCPCRILESWLHCSIALATIVPPALLSSAFNLMILINTQPACKSKCSKCK